MLEQYDLCNHELVRLITNYPQEELEPYLKWLSENDGVVNKPGYLRKVLESGGRLTVPVTARRRHGKNTRT